MKTVIYFIIFIFSLLSCSDNREEPVKNLFIPQQFLGKWKLTETKEYTSNGIWEWIPYESGKEYDVEYKNNGDFVTIASYQSQFSNCNYGKYYFLSDQKYFFSKSNCNTQEIKLELISLNSTDLYMHDSYIEGITYHYVKVIK